MRMGSLRLWPAHLSLAKALAVDQNCAFPVECPPHSAWTTPSSAAAKKSDLRMSAKSETAHVRNKESAGRSRSFRLQSFRPEAGRSTVLKSACLLLVLMIGAIASSSVSVAAPRADGGLRDRSYVSPSWGYSVRWYDGEWIVDGKSSSGG